MSKSIIVTGAGSGIGRSTAEHFLEAGWKVGLVGRRKEQLEETAAGNPNALVMQCDITNEDDVEQSFNRARDTWGRVDALFNNAGVALLGKTIDELNVDEWRNLMDINVTGSFICARKAFAIMRAQDRQS